MLKLSPILATLLLVVQGIPAFADERKPERTPWERAGPASDPTSDKVVRWVVEGCAAYPVTVDAPRDDIAMDEQADAEDEP